MVSERGLGNQPDCSQRGLVRVGLQCHQREPLPVQGTIPQCIQSNSSTSEDVTAV